MTATLAGSLQIAREQTAIQNVTTKQKRIMTISVFCLMDALCWPGQTKQRNLSVLLQNPTMQENNAPIAIPMCKGHPRLLLIWTQLEVLVTLTCGSHASFALAETLDCPAQSPRELVSRSKK